VTLKRRGTTTRSLETRSAGTAVGDVLALHHISDEVRAGRLETEWTELVGQKIAQRTRPDGVYRRTLWVEVVSAAWMKELDLLKPQILSGLLARLGEPKLFDNLEFRIARGRREAVPLRAKRPPPLPVRPLPPPASGAARERIVSEVAEVADDELRELIARVRIAHDR
jgi:hypothetical protein